MYLRTPIYSPAHRGLCQPLWEDGETEARRGRAQRAEPVQGHTVVTSKGRIRTLVSRPRRLRSWSSLPEVMGRAGAPLARPGKAEGAGSVQPPGPRPRPYLWNRDTEALRLPRIPWKPPSQTRVSPGTGPRSPAPPTAPARGGASPAPTGSRGGREK